MHWTLDSDRFIFNGLQTAVAFTTTRRSGILPGPVAAADLRQVADRFGLQPAAVVGMEQVHGAFIQTVQESEDAVLAGCDGLVTDQPGVMLAVRCADCLPLIAYHPGRRLLGVAHAGWRGIQAGIPTRLMEAMRSVSFSLADCHVAIGPRIGPCCYEVGPEFEDWFPEELQTRKGVRFLDLGKAVVRQLVKAGVPGESVVQAPWCTACTPDHCHSHRRQGPEAGRMVTAAMIIN